MLAAESPSAPEPDAPVEAESLRLPDAEEVREGIEMAEREEAERRRWLESPEATLQREESRYAFTGLSAAESRALLLSAFAVELERFNSEPARFLSDAQLVRPLGEDEAAATVREKGDGALLDASIPVRTEDESGELRKVDLTLEPAPGGFEAANPLSEVLIPASADQPVEIGERGLAVSAVGVSAESDAELLGDKNAFYPEALGQGSDADRLISPVAGGVEIFDLLRSADSPEVLRFEIELPEGAELHPDGSGGARIFSGKESVASIPAPRAVDAQGTPVPVELSVEGDVIALYVPHRGADVAYPLLVDPTIVEDSYNFNWFNGHNHQALDNGSWVYQESHAWIGGSTNCIYACWGRGLYVSMPGGGTFGGHQYGQWTYSAPNPNSFLDNAYANPFHRDDHNCDRSKYPQPHDYAGMWHNGDWKRVVNNEAIAYKGTDIKSWGSTFIVGLHTGGGGYYMPCWRDLGLGGAAVWLDDWDPPTIDSVSGLPVGKWFSDKTPIAIKIGTGDSGLGVRRVTVTNDGNTVVYKDDVGFCTGLYASRCPTSHSSEPKATGASFAEGIRGASVNVEDPTGKVATSGFQVMVDRTSPEITLEGQLANATDEKGSVEPPPSEDKAENLPLPVYNLAIKTEDGSTESNLTKRSGVKHVRISLDKEEMDVPWEPLAECPQSSCKRDLTYSLGLSGIETAGMHTLEIAVVDFAGNEHVRHVEFQYYPATGMKDEFVLHYFPLPDGLGNEAEEEHPARPELAVNVMNGNAVFRELDFEVEGAAVDLELERFYNSQLPDSESTEWGDGWTLAETPELDPAQGEGPPTEAEVVESSGALEGSIELPAGAGEEEFDPELQVTVEKEADGGYVMSDETGESATSVAFNEDGRAEALRTEGYAKVDYVYEAGQLTGIEVEDPATFAAEPEELEIDSGLVEEPIYSSSFGKVGSADGQLNSPADVAVDAAGNLWVVDRANNRLQKLSPEGKFLAKFGSYGTGDGQFNSPAAVAIDSKGNLWVADGSNRRVQKFDSTGKFLLKFGTQGTGNGQFSSYGPRGIAVDNQGNVWVSDYSGRIQKFNSSGQFLLAAGSYGSGNGQFGQSAGLDVGPDGRVWVADWTKHRISVFSEAGAWQFSFGLQGSGDAQFKNPDTVEVDREGNVWVGDQSNNRVQLFDSGAKFLAKLGSSGSGDGQFSFAYPLGIETDGKGHLWVTDVNNNRIQEWAVPIKTPAYAGSFGAYGSGEGQLKSPADVAYGLGGNLWVADRANNRIQKYGADGKFLAQFGAYGTADGQLNSPAAVAVDRDGNLLVADRGNNRIQKFSPEGAFISKFGSYGSADGQFKSPGAIATDFTSGDIWVCDSLNGRIQRFDEEGSFIEAVGSKGYGEGQLSSCTDLDIGPDGRIWAADWVNERVSAFDSEGEFLTELGSYGSGPGQLEMPTAVEVDRKGDVWVADYSTNRIQLFSAEGKYVRQLGSYGSGAGQLNLNSPMGIETDPKGRLWVADTNNNRVGRWLTANHQVLEAEPIELTDGDPAVQVEMEAGLIESVDGNAAGEHSYEHEGDALVAHEGPSGETAYEYDGEDRLTKVTLANGTWAEIAYDAHARVKSVTVDPDGEEPAETTSFEYTDTDPRRTTVIPPDAPHLVYDIGADGSVLKWWNKELPPELKLAGTLYDNREEPEPIWNGDHLLESQAKSKEGIASIKVIANGNQLVSEETCAQDPETPGLECTSLIIDQWVTSTDLHAPGRLQVEVITTDRIGNSSSERFWIDIPPPPPPPAPGSPVPPTFSQVSEFREEHGLEVVFPVKNEIELNERIFNLINAWYEGDSVARSTMERWGVPLRPSDVAELEWRLAYWNQASSVVPAWAASNAPNTFAGVYIDERAGGAIHVGFTSNQSALVEDLKQEAGLVASSRVHPFPTSPQHSLGFLEGLEMQIGGISAGLESGLLTTIGINPKANVVEVGATNVGQATSVLSGHLGAAPFSIKYEPVTPGPRGRIRNEGNVRAGDFVTSWWYEGYNVKRREEGEPRGNEGCTAGYGAWENGVEQSSGRPIHKLFLLSAGHCFQPIEEIMRADPVTQEPVRLAFARRTGIEQNGFGGSAADGYNTDVTAIRVDSPQLAPRQIYRDEAKPPLDVRTAMQNPGVGARVCHSGLTTNKELCGPIMGPPRTFTYWGRSGVSHPFMQVCYRAVSISGDSGGPVWLEGTSNAVGLVSYGWNFLNDKNKIVSGVTCFTPLRPLTGKPQAPGVLAAPGVTDAHDLQIMTRSP